MAIVEQTQKEKIARAQETDEQKLVFEKSLARSVLALLNKIADDFRILYTATGEIINASEYQEELTTILRTSYRRVSEYFKNDYKRLLQESIDAGNEDLKPVLETRNSLTDEINATILLLILGRAKSQAKIITETTNEIMTNSVTSVINDAVSNNIRLTNAETAKQAQDKIKERNPGRSELIAETETQAVAEESKFTEAQRLNDELKKNRVVQQVIEKEWMTMGDQMVRAAHARANGQKRAIQEPYIVGGEMLRFPGDMSLGASIWNVVRCRCISLTN